MHTYTAPIYQVLSAEINAVHGNVIPNAYSHIQVLIFDFE